MEMKEEFLRFLQQSYSVINDLNKSADMAAKRDVLEKNKQHCLAQVQDLVQTLHKFVDECGTELNDQIEHIISSKLETLTDHSNEIIQCMDYISNLCIMAEKLMKEKNLLVIKSFGPQLKTEFLKSLKECEEMKFVDYDSFVSLDVDIDLSQLTNKSFVQLVGRNPRNPKHFNILYSSTLRTSKNSPNILNQLPENRQKTQGGDSEKQMMTRSKKRDPSTCNVNNSSLSSGTLCPQPIQVPEGIQIKEELPDSWEDDTGQTDTSEASLLCNSGGLPNRLSGRCQFKTAVKIPSVSPKNSISGISHDNIDTVTDLTQRYESFTLNSKSKKSSGDMIPATSSHTLKTSHLEHVQPCYMDQEVQPVNNYKNSSKGDDDACTSIMNVSQNTLSKNATSCVDSEERNSAALPFNQSVNSSTSVTSVKKTSKAAPPTEKRQQTDAIQSCSVTQLWNQKNIEPIRVTFDLRTVMPVIYRAVPEIHGDLVKTIPGERGSHFDHPTGLTIMENGHLVVADTGNNMVKVLQDSSVIFCLGHKDGIKFARPSAVVCDTQNNIYVKDDTCIQVFDQKGKFLKSIGHKVFRHPYGLALVKGGGEPYLIVIDADRGRPSVYHYKIKEDKLQSFPYHPVMDFGTASSKVRFLATHNSTMLVSDLGASTMYLSSVSGKTLKRFGCYGHHLGEFYEPSGVTVDTGGSWLIGDSKNNRIQVFTSDGYFMALLKLSSPVRRPSGIHLSSDGLLYVINYLDSVIKVYKLRR